MRFLQAQPAQTNKATCDRLNGSVVSLPLPTTISQSIQTIYKQRRRPPSHNITPKRSLNFAFFRRRILMRKRKVSFQPWAPGDVATANEHSLTGPMGV